MAYTPRFSSNRMGALDFDWHMSEFERIRKSAGMVEFLTEMGTELVGRLNAELHGAQEARNQPVEDGYKFYITTDGEDGNKSRARLHIVAFTARGIAHEAVHQSILRMLGEAAAVTQAGRTARRALARAERDAARRARAARQED